MVYAIGKLENGDNIRILNCEDTQFIGSVWKCTDFCPALVPILVRFEPADQFCHWVRLDDIQKKHTLDDGAYRAIVKNGTVTEYTKLRGN